VRGSELVQVSSGSNLLIDVRCSGISRKISSRSPKGKRTPGCRMHLTLLLSSTLWGQTDTEATF
jgi:hypothetical protein